MDSQGLSIWTPGHPHGVCPLTATWPVSTSPLTAPCPVSTDLLTFPALVILRRGHVTGCFLPKSSTLTAAPPAAQLICQLLFSHLLSCSAGDSFTSVIIYHAFPPSADFPYNKSASLPGYGRNGIYKVNPRGLPSRTVSSMLGLGVSYGGKRRLRSDSVPLRALGIAAV